MPQQPEPQLFNLTISNRSGQYVGILLDEAVSEDPEFLVSVIRKAKQALAAMPPEPSALIKGVHNEHVDPAPRPIRDNPQA